MTVRIYNKAEIAGTIIFTVLAAGVFLWWKFDSGDDFGSRVSLKRRLLPILCMILLPYAWLRLRFYVEFGEEIVLRNLFGRKSHGWNSLTRIEFDEQSRSIKFRLGNPGNCSRHVFKVNDTQQAALEAMIHRNPNGPI